MSPHHPYHPRARRRHHQYASIHPGRHGHDTGSASDSDSETTAGSQSRSSSSDDGDDSGEGLKVDEAFLRDKHQLTAREQLTRRPPSRIAPPSSSNASNSFHWVVLIAATIFLVVGTISVGWKLFREQTAPLDSANGGTSATDSTPSAETTYQVFSTRASEVNAQSETSAASSTSSSGASKISGASAPSSTMGSSAGSGPGLFGVSDPVCGDSGATDEPGPGVGPNGAQGWLNCGLSKDDKSAKWTPPNIDISMLKYIDLADAVKLDIFAPCKEWVQLFNSVGADTGLPPIFLASIALTESTCKRDAVAPGGASWGLMQITTEKCSDAPNGDCTEPNFNVQKGADYFKAVMVERGGNFLSALGAYNGWPSEMTWESATAFASSDCVRQNNLDYLQSNLNGWMQGLDGNSVRTIKNLDSCGGS